VRQAKALSPPRPKLRRPRRPGRRTFSKLEERAHEIIARNLVRPIVPDDVAFMVPKAVARRRGMQYGPDLYMIVLLHQRRGIVGNPFAGGLQWEIGLSSPLLFDPEMAYDAARLILKPEELAMIDDITWENAGSCYWAQVLAQYAVEAREEDYFEALTKPLPDDHWDEFKPDTYQAKPTIVLASK